MGPVADGVTAGGEDVEGGEVVEDEDDVVGEEEEVVEEVEGEVGDAELEHGVLGVGVGGGEGGGFVAAEDCVGGHGGSRGAVG